jgi:hypothetical protein
MILSRLMIGRSTEPNARQLLRHRIPFPHGAQPGKRQADATRTLAARHTVQSVRESEQI